MASSESEVKTESDVTPAGEENLDFDENTSKGEASCYSLTRSRCETRENCSGLIFTVVRELSL